MAEVTSRGKRSCLDDDSEDAGRHACECPYSANDRATFLLKSVEEVAGADSKVSHYLTLAHLDILLESP